MADGVYTETPPAEQNEALLACALIASHIPTTPPRSWFENPRLTGPTPLTVSDDGKVFGHIAAWHVDHIGLPFGTRPPRSRSDYAYFHTGVVRTDEGADVPVGQLTLAGGHAPLEASASEAVKHYDDTASAIADVHAGEDAYGIWVAGALRPGVSPDQIRTLRASAPSGDWRPIQGRLELVAVCQVNVPGFPIARARVASGMVTALVAAGASPLAEMRERRTVRDALRERELAVRHQQAVERIEQARAERSLAEAEGLQALAASAATRVREARTAGYTELKVFSKETREEYARKGWALERGDKIIYPIKDVADLRRAIRSYGRAASEDKAAVRKHIIRRARGLGRADLIPESWAVTAAARARVALGSPGELDVETVEDGLASLTAALHFRRKRIFNEQLHPRDEQGKFRKVLYRLQQDLKGQTGTKKALDAIERAQDAENSGDLQAAKDAADDVIKLVDDIAENTEDLDLKDSLRQGSKSLGKVMAYLPLAQGDTTAKMRFTDLPMELRDLIDDLLERAKRKLEPAEYTNAAKDLLTYKSGGDFMFADEIQSHLSKLLRFLV